MVNFYGWLSDGNQLFLTHQQTILLEIGFLKEKGISQKGLEKSGNFYNILSASV